MPPTLHPNPVRFALPIDIALQDNAIQEVPPSRDNDPDYPRFFLTFDFKGPSGTPLVGLGVECGGFANVWDPYVREIWSIDEVDVDLDERDTNLDSNEGGGGAESIVHHATANEVPTSPQESVPSRDGGTPKDRHSEGCPLGSSPRQRGGEGEVPSREPELCLEPHGSSRPRTRSASSVEEQ